MTKSTDGEWSHLLACLGPDAETAEQEFHSIRSHLLRFFTWRNSPDPESLADETIARVATYLYQRNEMISSPKKISIFFVTALNVWREGNRRNRRRAQVEAMYQKLAVSPDIAEIEEKQKQLEAIHEAVDSLSPGEHELVVTYYQGAGRTRIQNRKKLAKALGISMNNLRVRACRIRSKLETRLIEQRKL